MNIISFAIKNPVTVLVGVLMVCLFGGLSILTLPVQLTPNVDKPEITVRTSWEGASPREVEREIIEVQEEKLKSIQGLTKMTSSSSEGSGSIKLEFKISTDMSRALLDTADRLRQVRKYPVNVDPPTIRSGVTDVSRAIAWFILKSNPPREDIVNEFNFIDDFVKPRLERVTGVASINIYGGADREVHVRVSPEKLAQRGITLIDVRNAITDQNINVSLGNMEEGKREYVMRLTGQYESIDELLDTIILKKSGLSIYLKDVGDVVFGRKEQRVIVRASGEPALAINATRESGTNVISIMTDIQNRVAEINREILKPRNLELIQVYDETVYIKKSIALVKENILIGALLSICVLLIFLRNIPSTLIIGMAIPISVIGTFLLLKVSGRNINVISLAGMAFAVGMVVDNSIVVLENIFRHIEQGEKPFDAALKGGANVWGAVLASTLTTLAVFIPVILIQEEAGQLFRDIAVAISAAVMLSLIVSVLFIPMAGARLLKHANGDKQPSIINRLFGLVYLGTVFTDAVTWTLTRINRSWIMRILVVSAMTAASVFTTITFWPPLSYLPDGNRNLVIGFLIPPPGYGKEELTRISKTIEKRLKPYLTAKPGSPEAEKLDGPLIKHYFIVSRGESVFIGLKARDPEKVKGLVTLVRRVTATPGLFSFASQRSLFQRGLGAGNSVDVEVSGSLLAEVVASAKILQMEIMKRIGFPRPDPPNFSLGGPEVRVLLDKEKTSELGLTFSDAGFILKSLVDGTVIGEFRDRGNKIDIKILPNKESVNYIENLESTPVAIPGSRLVPLSSFAKLVHTEGPAKINHIESRAAVKLIVTPPASMELETIMKKIREEIVSPLRADKMIPKTVDINLAGTADKLVSTRDALKWNLLLAILITYLLMASLFESFLYPFVIMFSVPLAGAGGILGFSFIHKMTGEHLNILSMLGFIILVGTVVNNAILIVHQALNNMKIHGRKDPDLAIIESVKSRIRPIFMSTTTSVFGMLPLVLMSGSGSELYRGLGSVVIGGMITSTVFTLVVVPTLFSLVFSIWTKFSTPDFLLQKEETI